MEREDLNLYLQHVPKEELYSLRQRVEDETEVRLVQRPTPQTLLVPVRDPINGGSFYGGEVLVTSSIVQVNGSNGWAMVMDENFELSRSLAILDGAYGAGVLLEEIKNLALRGRSILKDEKQSMSNQVENTRVSFDLMGGQ